MPNTSDIGIPRLSASRLSPAAASVWAKSWPNPSPDGVIESWLPLHRHLADTAAIAGKLWDGWLPPHIKRTMTVSVGDEASARALAVWLAGCHDVGKASPAFAVQVRRLALDMSDLGLRMDHSLADTELRRTARHELVSHLAVMDWLVTRQRFSTQRARKLGSVLAAHHGRPASSADVDAARNQSLLVGTGEWADVRHEIIEAVTADTVTSDQLDVWRRSDLSQHVLALLSGFVIVSDWIASNDALFELAPLQTDAADTTEHRAARAWSRLALPAPWRANAPDDTTLFAERFAGLAAPRPIQSALMRLARQAEAPGLVIVEAEMGVGKTEAALAAAEILATRFGLSGVFLGLPTQATADGMFARALTWAQHLGLETPLTVHLGHGKARENRRFERLQTQARFRSIGDRYENRPSMFKKTTDASAELVVAHHWLSDPKRGPLANLVVATIDQALFTALRSKHVMLRHLALASKVVVLDEVHAYDAYMNEYLERALHWLGAYGVPVIMLSATLPSDRRKAFVAAYDSGRGIRPERSRRPRIKTTDQAPGPAMPDRLERLNGDIGYPSIVASGSDGTPTIVLPESTGGSRQIALERIDDDRDAMAAILADALSEGGTAVVIHNSVRRVLDTAQHLRDRTDIPVLVAHSRFLARDRAAKDLRLLSLFGKGSTERPDRMIVVASQVVEQSLDIDFDLMITDLAPVDLLLQRAGRLHRHTRTGRPAKVRSPRLILTGTDWAQEPPRAVRASTYVYDPFVLLRTAAALHDRATLTLPSDIPSLVQGVYGPEDLGPDAWHPVIEAAREQSVRDIEKKQARARVFRLSEEDTDASSSLLGWIAAGTGDPSADATAEASVRDTAPTLEVLVVQRDEYGTLRVPEWMSEGGGTQIPENEPPGHALTRVILGCSLRLPATMCRGGLIDKLIRQLEEMYPVSAWHGSHALRGELVLELDSERNAFLDPFDLHYSPEHGLSFSERRHPTGGHG